MKKWLGIGILILAAMAFIWVETCWSGSIGGEDTLLLPGGYYEPCGCDLSTKDRGILRGYVRDRYSFYLLFDVKQDTDHVYVAGGGRGKFYHIARPREAPAE